MQPQTKPPNVLGILAVLCGFLFFLFLIVGSPEAGAMLAVFVWFIIAIPYAMLRVLVNLSREPLPGKKAEPKPKSTPGLSDQLDAARSRYEANMLRIDRMGLDPAELYGLKEKAKAKYLQDIERILP